jgi:hypothetical protein
MQASSKGMRSHALYSLYIYMCVFHFLLLLVGSKDAGFNFILLITLFQICCNFNQVIVSRSRRTESPCKVCNFQTPNTQKKSEK